MVRRPQCISPGTLESDSESRNLVEDKAGELLDKVDKLLVGSDDEDAEDGPDWAFEEGEKCSSDPTYMFCPAPHQKMFFTFSPNTSASIHSSPNVVGLSLLLKSRPMLLWKCTFSVGSVVSMKSGVTFGCCGIHQKCGNYGPTHCLHSFLGYGLQ
jgi:hypothetical protein